MINCECKALQKKVVGRLGYNVASPGRVYWPVLVTQITTYPFPPVPYRPRKKARSAYLASR